MNKPHPLKAVNKKYLAVVVITLIVVTSYFSVQYFVDKKLADLQTQIKSKITEQEKLLAAISDATARSTADDETKLIIRDCNLPERTEFDTLLGQLDKGLTIQELTKLDQLFGRCGSFYAVQKSVMVLRLKREVDVYKSQVEQLQAISNEKAATTYNVEGWSTLATEEEKQSTEFTKMVEQQDEIIKALLAGKRADSPEIKEILAHVSETQQSLYVANRQAADVRTKLVPQ